MLAVVEDNSLKRIGAKVNKLEYQLTRKGELGE